MFTTLLWIVLATQGYIIWQQRKLAKLMATADERLAGVETALDEASTEILALIAKLRGESLSAEGLATLDRLEVKAKALADVVPNP